MLAALEGDKPDQRVFDVKIGDKIVLKSFDPATHKGAIVEQFENIPAIENLMVELIPATPPSEPIHKVLKILHTNAQEITGGVADK